MTRDSSSQCDTHTTHGENCVKQQKTTKKIKIKIRIYFASSAAENINIRDTGMMPNFSGRGFVALIHLQRARAHTSGEGVRNWSAPAPAASTVGAFIRVYSSIARGGVRELHRYLRALRHTPVRTHLLFWRDLQKTGERFLWPKKKKNTRTTPPPPPPPPPLPPPPRHVHERRRQRHGPHGEGLLRPLLRPRRK